MVISAWAESEVTPLPDWYEVWLHTALRKTYSGCWNKMVNKHQNLCRCNAPDVTHTVKLSSSGDIRVRRLRGISAAVGTHASR